MYLIFIWSMLEYFVLERILLTLFLLFNQFQSLQPWVLIGEGTGTWYFDAFDTSIQVFKFDSIFESLDMILVLFELDLPFFPIITLKMYLAAKHWQTTITIEL